MSVNKTYNDTRISNFNGGIDSLNSPSDIADGAFTKLVNFSTSGNRLVTMKTNSWWGVGLEPITGITTYHEDVFFIQEGKIKSYNISDSSRVNIIGVSLSGTPTSTRYNLTCFKFGSGIYIVICDSNGLEDVRIYNFNKVGLSWTFTPHIIGGLPADSKFTCAKFYKSRLHLSGAPTTNGIVYWTPTYRLTDQSAAPNSFISLTGAGAGQLPVGESKSPVVGFAVRQDNFYCLTKAGIYKLYDYTFDSVNLTSVYKEDKETNNGVIGYYAVCETEQDVFYFDGRNVRRLSYESNGNSFSVKDVNISSAVDNFVRDNASVNQNDAVMVFNYPYLYTFIRSNDTSLGNGNDIAIVYNVRDENWTTTSGEMVGVGANYFYKTAARGIVGSSISQRGIVLLNESNGFNRAYASSKEYSTFDDVDYKRYAQFEMSGLITTGTKVDIEVFVDGEYVETFSIIGGNNYSATTGTVESGVAQSGSLLSETLSTMVGYTERFELYNAGRTFHYNVIKDGYGEFEIHSINFKWKPSPAYPSH